MPEGVVQRRQSQAISSGAQWQDDSEQAQTETWEVSPEFQEMCFSLWGVTEHWYRLPIQVMESQFLEIFKSSLRMVLHNTLTVALLEQRDCTKLPLGVSSNLNNSVIFTNVEFMKSLQFLDGLNSVCLCSCNVYWGEFGFSGLGNHPSPIPVYLVDWNVYWDHAKGELDSNGFI